MHADPGASGLCQTGPERRGGEWSVVLSRAEFRQSVPAPLPDRQHAAFRGGFRNRRLPDRRRHDQDTAGLLCGSPEGSGIHPAGHSDDQRIELPGRPAGSVRRRVFPVRRAADGNFRGEGDNRRDVGSPRLAADQLPEGGPPSEFRGQPRCRLGRRRKTV